MTAMLLSVSLQGTAESVGGPPGTCSLPRPWVLSFASLVFGLWEVLLCPSTSAATCELTAVSRGKQCWSQAQLLLLPSR